MDLNHLKQIITQWNQNRLDLFELSQPNEDMEFHGVMRFFFQDAGQKVSTKCIRVASTASALDVINTLIEKFRPDIRMLSIPEYALFEIHENNEERQIGEGEKPLFVQLNWHHDDREGRFLLRRMNEKTILPGFDPEQSNFRRKLSKREKKEQKKMEKEKKLRKVRDPKDGVAEKLYTEVPETSFTRSISNPEAVMRRRRQQKLEKKLQQLCQEGGPEAGGTLRIFGETLNRDVPYKTLLLSTRDTAGSVLGEILEKYGLKKEDSPNYCLIQLVVPHNLTDAQSVQDLNGNPGVREIILDDDDCPLAIEKQHLKQRGTLSFHIKKRPPDCASRKKKKKPLHLNQLEINSEEIRERLQSLNPTANGSISSNSNNNVAGPSGDIQNLPPGSLHNMNHGVQHQDHLNHINGNPSLQHMSQDQRSSSTATSHSNSQYCPSDEATSKTTSPNPDMNGPHNLPSSTRVSVVDSGLATQFPFSVSNGHRSSESDANPNNFPRSASSVPAQLRSGGPEIKEYLLQKSNNGMGLSIVATKGIGHDKLGIYVKTVVKGGAADLDGRLEAGDQLLKVNGNSLLGVTQERAAELITLTGPIVTLEVAKQAASYNGLASILNQPSPLAVRQRLPHSQSYAGPPPSQPLPQTPSTSQQPQQQSQQPSSAPQPNPSHPPLPSNHPSQMHPHHHHNPVHMTNGILPSAQYHLQQPMGHPVSVLTGSSIIPSSMSPVGAQPFPHMQHHLHLQGQHSPMSTNAAQVASLMQEERHYQNISMYRQPLPPNGQTLTNGGSLRTPLNGPAPYHHASYSSLHQPPPGSGPMSQQMSSNTLPGRPMSTAYPSSMTMGRHPSMPQYPQAQYGTTGMPMNGPPQPMFRSNHSGSVPALQYIRHPNIDPSYPPSPSMLYGPSPNSPASGHFFPTRGQMPGPRSAIKPVDPDPPVQVSYRYGPTGYPSSKSIDNLNNNSTQLNHNNQNGINTNTSHMNGGLHPSSHSTAGLVNGMQTLPHPKSNNNQWTSTISRTKHHSAQDINATLEEQEERLRQLRLEEIKRHQELEVAHMVEERLLQDAKNRRQDDEMMKLAKGYPPKLDLIHGNNQYNQQQQQMHPQMQQPALHPHQTMHHPMHPTHAMSGSNLNETGTTSSMGNLNNHLHHLNQQQQQKHLHQVHHNQPSVSSTVSGSHNAPPPTTGATHSMSPPPVESGLGVTRSRPLHITSTSSGTEMVVAPGLTNSAAASNLQDLSTNGSSGLTGNRYPSALRNGGGSGVGGGDPSNATHASSITNTSTSSASPANPPKKVSWNDSSLQTTHVPDSDLCESSEPTTPTTPSAMDVSNPSGFTLEDIDEALGTSTELEGMPSMMTNTPNVIGAQEVYRDPRERMMKEKMKNQPNTPQGPEKLSFKEKMKMFAMTQEAAAQNNGSNGKKEGGDGSKSESPIEESSRSPVSS